MLVATSDQLDQYVVRHPEFFFGASPEHARIDPDQLLILLDHIRCAAFELPFAEDERYGGQRVDEILDYLVDQKVLHRSGDRYHWMSDTYPAEDVSLRSAAPDNVVIIDRSGSMLGDKIAAKETMKRLGVPCVPGSETALGEDMQENLRVARGLVQERDHRAGARVDLVQHLFQGALPKVGLGAAALVAKVAPARAAARDS